LTGLGGEKADGRWHTAARGKRIVYLSEHPAVALIEALANLKGNPALFPTGYQLMKVMVEDSVSVEYRAATPQTLAYNEDIAATQGQGDSWLSKGSSALLAVPSIPSPESLNYLFNPLHPDATKISIEWCRWIEYDKRLFQVRQ
jgi:RES domain-containing protein